MQSIILIGSIIGILNSLILIGYSLMTKKGKRETNLIFALLIFVLTLRISKSILLTFSDGLHDILLTIGLSGFMAIGPVYYFLSDSALNPKFQFKWKQLLHLLPAIVFTFLWVFLDQIRNDRESWSLFYRFILLQYMIYLAITIYKCNMTGLVNPGLKRQLNVISAFLLAIWFAYMLNEVSGFPYIAGAILYSVLIYFSLFIILNKGFIIQATKDKYQKTGLKSAESERIFHELEKQLKKEKVYKDNLLSLGRLAKRIHTQSHLLSQVINENYRKSFFELISSLRVEEAKHLLENNEAIKVSEVAFEVGYNSISAFNTAFKKQTGLTPSQFRNGK